MKRNLTIILFLIVSLLSYAQETDSCTAIISAARQMHNEGRDVEAKKYLEQYQGVFERNQQLGVFLGTIVQLNSNIWHSNNSTPELAAEYKEILQTLITDELLAESYQPASDLVQLQAMLLYDFSLMLHADGKEDDALKMLATIHRWAGKDSQFKSSFLYATSLFQYCQLYLMVLHKYKEAIPLYEEYVERAKAIFGENSIQYALALYNLSICYSTQSRTKESRELAEKAVPIYEKAGGDPETLARMKAGLNMDNTLATGRTDINGAVKNAEGCQTIEECTILIAANRGAEALESLKNLKTKVENEAVIDTLRYGAVVNLLAQAYIDIGDMSTAKKEIDHFDKEIGINKLPMGYAENFYNSLAIIACKLNDYPLALAYYKESLLIHEKIGSFDFGYARTLANMSIAYAESGDNLAAKWHIDEAMSVFENTTGALTDSGNSGLTLLGSCAYIYFEIGETDKAISIWEKIVRNYSNDPNTQDAVTLAVNNLSSAYMSCRDYDSCIKLLTGAKGKVNAYDEYITQNLMLAYYLKGDARAEQPLMEYDNIIRNNCFDIFNYFSERDREAYWTYNARVLFCNAMAAEKFPQLTPLAYDNTIFIKNLSLMSESVVRDFVKKCNIPGVMENYTAISDLRDKITYDTHDRDSLAVWNSELRQREQELTQSIPDFKERLANSFPTWQNVQTSLEKGDLAVEFTYVPVMKGTTEDDITYFYGALVLSKDDKSPRLIMLGKYDEIENVANLQSSDMEQISYFYNNMGTTSLYSKVWQKLEPYMKGRTNIYFSPISALNTVNHSALSLPDGTRLGDKYNMIQLSSTARIAQYKSGQNSRIESAAIFGGINYDETVVDMQKNSSKYVKARIIDNDLALRSEDERGYWHVLAGTKAEAEDINALLQTGKVRTRMFEWNDASEEAFKSLGGHPADVIHLATHGFYINSEEKFKANSFMASLGGYSSKEDNLTRTGLLLAGANNVWRGKTKITGMEDGILTADEVSRLDLKGAHLVVLSACETARGYVDEVDGVLGLQRGFKKAGAETIVMSLWKVPDIATSQLMKFFYRYLISGYDVRTALSKARQELIKSNSNYSNPYYWAAFIVLD